MNDQTPRMHDWQKVVHAIESSDLDSIELLETIAFLATHETWREVWEIADLLSREVSILFDSENRVWVDIGTAGMVRPEPPIGSRLPLRLWVHTHPYNAYWSPTDLDTLAIYSTILQEALVLGHDHLKRTVTNDGSEPSLGNNGPLRYWTSEDTVNYDNLEELDAK